MGGVIVIKVADVMPEVLGMSRGSSTSGGDPPQVEIARYGEFGQLCFGLLPKVGHVLFRGF